jgi:hypothetical protein
MDTWISSSSSESTSITVGVRAFADLGVFWKIHNLTFGHGCQIFLGTTYQNGQNFNKWPQNIPIRHKIYQMAIKISNDYNIFSISKPSQNLVWKRTIGQPCFRATFRRLCHKPRPLISRPQPRSCSSGVKPYNAANSLHSVFSNKNILS